MGGIHALKVRRVMQDLVKQSLVSIEEVHGKEYYYIDFVHFIKLVRLRFVRFVEHLAQGPGATANAVRIKEFQCPECHREYSQLDVVSLFDMSRNNFACERDNTLLRKIADTKAAYSDSANLNSAELRRKFDVQTSKELGQREGIVKFLEQLDGKAAFLPENRPSLRLLKERVEEVRQERAATMRASGRRDDGSSMVDVRVVAGASGDSTAELMPFLAVSSVTLQETEEGLESRLAQEAKRRRFGEAQAAQVVRVLEVAVRPVASEFTFGGRTVALGAITDDDVLGMTQDERDEYWRLRGESDDV